MNVQSKKIKKIYKWTSETKFEVWKHEIFNSVKKRRETDEAHHTVHIKRATTQDNTTQQTTKQKLKHSTKYKQKSSNNCIISRSNSKCELLFFSFSTFHLHQNAHSFFLRSVIFLVSFNFFILFFMELILFTYYLFNVFFIFFFGASGPLG